jgi:hypothetical protein
MNRFLHYLIRLTRVAAGFILAIAVGAAIVLILDLNKGRIPEPLAGSVMVGFLTFQAARFMWPLLMMEFIAEAMGWRALVFHLGVGLAGAGAALAYGIIQAGNEPPDPILLEEPAFTFYKLAVAMAAGLAGGLVYWLVAGRSAGLLRPERTDP